MDRSTLTHPAFRTAAGTLAGYGLLLLVMTLSLFLVPYAIFAGF